MSIITTSFQGQPFKLVADVGLDWIKHPLTLSKGECKTFDFPRIISILNGSVRSPLGEADIAYDNAVPCLQAIEQTFIQAIAQYRKDGKMAQRNDLKAISTIISSHNKFWIWLWSSYFQKESCCYRKFWLYSIATLEKKRIHEMGMHVKMRLEMANEELASLAESGLTSMLASREAFQLCTFAKVHFASKNWFKTLATQTASLLQCWKDVAGAPMEFLSC